MNYFEVFGLPRRLAIDTEALQAKFYELSRRHHPDFHQMAPPDEQARALEASALLNAAYRTLRDPIARIEYLIRLEEGRRTKEGSGVRTTAPPELLAEMFEVQEALQEAREGGLDPARRAELARQREALAERYRSEEVRLRGRLSEAWDAAALDERPGALESLKVALATRAYLRTVIDDLNAVIGASEDYVAHHRH